MAICPFGLLRANWTGAGFAGAGRAGWGGAAVCGGAWDRIGAVEGLPPDEPPEGAGRGLAVCVGRRDGAASVALRGRTRGFGMG